MKTKRRVPAPAVQPTKSRAPGDYADVPRAVLENALRETDEALLEAGRDGVVMSYTGRAAPWQIIRMVKPKLSHIVQRLSAGDQEAQTRNEIWDGENLSVMVTLYKYRGEVDLIVTDPPYNTGEDFRYNDKWDKDPNDPDLGSIVPKDDGSRHSKWLRFMTPRIWMMKEMLKPGGVIAICIDHRELFRLGMLMDEIFLDRNRLAIINWQKSAAPRSDNEHVSTSTEYVLVYAKDLDKARTGSLDRLEKDNKRYSNPDRDRNGDWREGNLTARSYVAKDDYAIQSPFTGEIHYPPGSRVWSHPKKNIRAWLEEWGSEYVERDIGDKKVPALMIKGASVGAVPKAIAKKAQARLDKGNWPFVWFGRDGTGRPRIKTYLEQLRRGKVPVTYWADEDFGYPAELESTSWGFKESGRSSDGSSELTAVVGDDHDFKTVKPLKLFKKLIQIWSGLEGLVMDPFAGSGTTAHAILELNAQQEESNRRFVVIEQGNTDKGDHYAKTLTADRIKRVVTGNWAEGKRKGLYGGFRFIELQREQIDADAVHALVREEMIDLLLTSYWDKADRARSYLRRLPPGKHTFLFAVNAKNEGFFLVWQSSSKPSVLDREVFRGIVGEAKTAGLAARYHVYASVAPYTGAGIEFYKIPDRVLEHIGFNTRSDAFNNETVAIA